MVCSPGASSRVTCTVGRRRVRSRTRRRCRCRRTGGRGFPDPATQERRWTGASRRRGSRPRAVGGCGNAQGQVAATAAATLRVGIAGTDDEGQCERECEGPAVSVNRDRPSFRGLTVRANLELFMACFLVCDLLVEVDVIRNEVPVQISSRPVHEGQLGRRRHSTRWPGHLAERAGQFGRSARSLRNRPPSSLRGISRQMREATTASVTGRLGREPRKISVQCRS